jgi:hypothetical protein
VIALPTVSEARQSIGDRIASYKGHVMSMSSPDAEKPGSSGRDSRAAAGVCPFAPAPQHFCPPRLGIIHLLAWTAATAATLKYFMAAMSRLDTSGMPASAVTLSWAFGFVMAIVFGADAVGEAVVLNGKLRGQTGRLQPGHWFVLIYTLATLAAWSMEAIVVLFAVGGQPGHRFTAASAHAMHVAYVVFPAIRSFTYLIVAARMRDARRWQVATRIVAVTDLAVLALQFLPLVSWSLTPVTRGQIRGLVVGTTFLVALLSDLRRGPRRDWVHWLGVAVIVADSIFPMALRAWVALLRHVV